MHTHTHMNTTVYIVQNIICPVTIFVSVQKLNKDDRMNEVILLSIYLHKTNVKQLHMLYPYLCTIFVQCSKFSKPDFSST